jgi:plastocyanin
MVASRKRLKGACRCYPCYALLIGLLAAGNCHAQEDKPAAAIIVRMTDELRFEPARVVIHVGASVEWQNKSSQPHTVTADARRAADGTEVVLPARAAPFDSQLIAPGGSYRHAFTVPGTYKYICVPHAALGMTGEVIVQSRATDSPHAHTEAPQQPRQEAMDHDKEHAAEKVIGWPSGPAGEIIRWLGTFHPPAASFPIALLVAAAIAEVLFAATRRPVFDAANRFCLWFGALAAVVTGTLGWFTGGFRTADASWIMRTHRWVGTSADVLAIMTLVLGEVSRRPGWQRVRHWFRALLIDVALMVLAAGFFGGALVYGIRHYAWP